jgi:hypothetical protein
VFHIDAHWLELWNTFVSVIISWCTIAAVKITFPDDIDDDIEDIRELLADADKKLVRINDT